MQCLDELDCCLEQEVKLDSKICNRKYENITSMLDVLTEGVHLYLESTLEVSKRTLCLVGTRIKNFGYILKFAHSTCEVI